MEGCLAEHQHEPASLLEADIRGSCQEAIRCGMGYRGEAVHRAGRDHHADSGEASRCDGGADIGVGICVIRHASEIVHGHVGFVTQSAFARLGDDEMGLKLEGARYLQ